MEQRRDRALALTDIRKEFGGVVAIEDFSLDVCPRRGRGAGRRQRRRQVDAGQDHLPASIRRPPGAIADRRRRWSISPTPARRAGHGIQVVYQDLALADQQTVYMNLFLGRETVTRPASACSTAGA